ncbi:amidohydrolase [Qipengyuania marisflavi]|uniref:Amidohydrolase n=1 Tax=Qipengyuania marisflavi TaxID=2486356 RepID=A0A5S3P8K9_9SPHN|nr:amidohydrolase [Qipengyuania marisflavi]TMM48774.1 amidohydrolase [Qipengyuania marisflavi]
MTLKLLASTAALACALLASPLHADVLIDNVEGLTIDKDGKVKRFAAIVIDDEGRVSQLLAAKDKRPRTDYREDGAGRVMIPGLIDAHAHVMGLGIGALTLDLSDTNSLQEALAAIARFAAENPARPWILGRGWNQEKWGLGRFPTAAELDSAVSDRPVYLERVDGHAGWANGKALEAAGIVAGTKSPDGGRIERASGSQMPSGVFVDNATTLMTAAIPAPRPAERDLALDAAQKILHKFGITGVADMGTTIEDWQAFRRAGDTGRLHVRIMSYAASADAMELIAGARPTPWLYDDKLRMNGIKIYLDGALGSRGAWLKAPYSDDPGNTGLPLTDSARLRNVMVRAANGEFQTAVHAIGDAANAEAISAIAELSESFTGDRRWRIEHVQIVDPADLPTLGKHSIISSMQPVHQTSDRTMAEARLGPNRLDGAYAWNTILRYGGKLAFGSDAPVESPDPFAGLAAAISRTGPDGQPFGGWRPQERVNREQALAGFTSDAAFAGFADGRFGRLLPGERADFVLIDRDPLLATPEELRATKVYETWVGGRKVYDAD